MLIGVDVMKKYKSKMKGIYHIGAHTMEENNYYFDLGVNRVLWFEANPKLVEMAKPNLLYIATQEIYNELLLIIMPVLLC